MEVIEKGFNLVLQEFRQIIRYHFQMSKWIQITCLHQDPPSLSLFLSFSLSLCSLSLTHIHTLSHILKSKLSHTHFISLKSFAKNWAFWGLQINLVPAENLTSMTSQCTESGLWQQLDFTCLFDPLAVNLKQGTKIFGGEKTQMDKKWKWMKSDFAVLQHQRKHESLRVICSKSLFYIWTWLAICLKVRLF